MFFTYFSLPLVVHDLFIINGLITADVTFFSGTSFNDSFTLFIWTTICTVVFFFKFYLQVGVYVLSICSMCKSELGVSSHGSGMFKFKVFLRETSVSSFLGVSVLLIIGINGNSKVRVIEISVERLMGLKRWVKKSNGIIPMGKI